MRQEQQDIMEERQPKIVRGARVSETMHRHAKMLRRTMTPEETILWQHLRAGRLGGIHFRRQQVIAAYVADFYCHQARLVIELDGDIHLRQREYDAIRDEIMAAKGLRVMRILNRDVQENLAAVLIRIEEACRG